MITFLRKIRKNLMNEKSFSSYLLYAMGEVALVVIGIMIALQLDNWNENNKVQESIDKHLITLRQNLNEDQAQLKDLHEVMVLNSNHADSLLNQLKTLIPVTNKTMHYLTKLILEYEFRPNKNAIETISQSNELPYLSSELQTAILDYYSLISSANEREKISNINIQSKYEPYIVDNYPEIFQKKNDWAVMRDYYLDDPRNRPVLEATKFLKDGTLEALLFSRYYQSITLKEFYSRLIISSDKILSLIP